MIVTGDAADYAALLDATSEPDVPFVVCTTREEAVDAYDRHRILFGDPSLIAGLLPGMPTVEWVQSTWAGVTHLLVGGRSDYMLTNVRGIFGPLMTEYVLAYMLANEIGILQRVEHQRRREWPNDVSGTLRGKRLGIMGTGSIGAHIAGALHPFGMHVSGLSRSGSAVGGFDRVFRVDQLESFLRDLDYLVCVLPHTAHTDRLLDADALAALPDRAYLINVGRGNVLDHGALAAALRDGRLSGAVLDVFEHEPLPPEDPLWTTPNLLVTGHVAAHSHPADIVPIFLRNYHRFVSGEPLEFVVDFARGY